MDEREREREPRPKTPLQDERTALGLFTLGIDSRRAKLIGHPHRRVASNL